MPGCAGGALRALAPSTSTCGQAITDVVAADGRVHGRHHRWFRRFAAPAEEDVRRRPDVAGEPMGVCLFVAAGRRHSGGVDSRALRIGGCSPICSRPLFQTRLRKASLESRASLPSTEVRETYGKMWRFIAGFGNGRDRHHQPIRNAGKHERRTQKPTLVFTGNQMLVLRTRVSPCRTPCDVTYLQLSPIAGYVRQSSRIVTPSDTRVGAPCCSVVYDSQV